MQMGWLFFQQVVAVIDIRSSATKCSKQCMQWLTVYGPGSACLVVFLYGGSVTFCRVCSSIYSDVLDKGRHSDGGGRGGELSARGVLCQNPSSLFAVALFTFFFTYPVVAVLDLT